MLQLLVLLTLWQLKKVKSVFMLHVAVKKGAFRWRHFSPFPVALTCPIITVEGCCCEETALLIHCWKQVNPPPRSLNS